MPEIPTLAQVLAEHARRVDFNHPAYGRCRCGIDPDDLPGEMTHAEHQAAAWREACTIETVEDLDRIPARSVVRSSAGTIACRFDGRNGVVFGDDRPFPWHKLALPAVVLWHPGWSA